jgi:hypothetical protein
MNNNYITASLIFNNISKLDQYYLNITKLKKLQLAKIFKIVHLNKVILPRFNHSYNLYNILKLKNNQLLKKKNFFSFFYRFKISLLKNIFKFNAFLKKKALNLKIFFNYNIFIRII